ncbi:50S ribosomal protein L4 [Methylacidimicrobium cyclopophantes]|uniref:Large ribosomal subunit protein uL4 n=1 Tax=Methylacidimicrobium cyclopophantes TaxID=1041766 RepID=A0A5E6MC09_9BACT|nr:50S ribosomal protein L4 [Methylacidimicrobium cyclopophantes]VVM05865.1 50S ribosomal protein L4 [Methylacidimicrobium cyclopophantes]
MKVLTVEEVRQELRAPLLTSGRGSQALHDAIVAYRANRRSGTRATKTKGTVRGSGKKPWAQKGTGRARAGYASSPIWRGGGVVFGPQPRDFSKKLPKKVKRLALLKALSGRIAEGAVFFTETIELPQPKTKELLKRLDSWDRKETLLLVVEKRESAVWLAARNHPLIAVVSATEVNAEDLLWPDRVVLERPALPILDRRLDRGGKQS